MSIRLVNIFLDFFLPGTGTEANGEGKVYLSPIIDCFDGMPITWTVGTSPNAELVNTMLDNAIVLLKENEHPIVHSDRGCHYRWSGWIQRMDEAGLTRSMSKKGCSQITRHVKDFLDE